MKNLNLLLASSLISFSGATLAHTEVISTKPENNASIAHDENIEVVFSSGIIHKMTRVKLINTDNTKEYGVNFKIDDNNKKLIITPKNNLEKGHYEVSWRAVSADTHAVNGKITFSVK